VPFKYAHNRRASGIAVGVAVLVGVKVLVLVGVAVGVCVSVGVDVAVLVGLGLGVAVKGRHSMNADKGGSGISQRLPEHFSVRCSTTPAGMSMSIVPSPPCSCRPVFGISGVNAGGVRVFLPAGIVGSVGVGDGVALGDNVGVAVLVERNVGVLVALGSFVGVLVHVGVIVLVGTCVLTNGVAVAVTVGAGGAGTTIGLHADHKQANNNAPSTNRLMRLYVCGSYAIRRAERCTSSQSIVGSLSKFMLSPEVMLFAAVLPRCAVAPCRKM
jgi:hypothetical protein